jgi:hypothetical protein
VKRIFLVVPLVVACSGAPAITEAPTQAEVTPQIIYVTPEPATPQPVTPEPTVEPTVEPTIVIPTLPPLPTQGHDMLGYFDYLAHQQTFVNGMTEFMESMGEAEGLGEMASQSRQLVSRIEDEMDWIAANPPDDCWAVSFAPYKEGVEMMDRGARAMQLAVASLDADGITEAGEIIVAGIERMGESFTTPDTCD